MMKIMQAALALGLLASSLGAAKAKTIRSGLYSGPWPSTGELDSAVPFRSRVSGTPIGTRRYSDRGYAIAINSNYGRRGTFDNPFNLSTSFNVSIDFTKMKSDNAAVLMFSNSASDPYIDNGPGGNGSLFSIDFVKSSLTPHNYCITLSTSAHNTSVSGSEWPNTPWSGNSAYVGLELVANDDVINFSLEKTGENVEVAVNGTKYKVPATTLYTHFPDNNVASTYIAFGTMNGGDAPDHIDIKQIGDADDEVYYGETGDYTIQKGLINQFIALCEAGLDNLEKWNQAKAVLDQIDITKFREYDKAYVIDGYNSAKSIYDTATITLGNETVIADFRTAANSFHSGVEADLTKSDNIKAAFNLYEVLPSKIAAIDALTDLTSEQSATIAALKEMVTNDLTKLKTAAGANYKTSVDHYASIELSDISKVEEALKAKQNINVAYAEYITEEEQTAYKDKIEKTDKAITSTAQASPEGWTIGTRSYTIKNGDKMGYLSKGSIWGESLTDAVNTNALIYSKEKLSALDFSLSLDIKDYSKNDEAWWSIGLMEKPGYFSSADNDSVQDNKGVFLLIRSDAAHTKINVEAYMCTLSSNRFFDGLFGAGIDVPWQNSITIQFKVEKSEIGGISEDYFVPIINGVKIDAYHVRANKVKTALGTDCEGYLYLGTNAAGIDNPYAFEITDINGYKPYESSLKKKEKEPDPGTSEDSSSSTPNTSSEGGGSGNSSNSKAGFLVALIGGIVIIVGALSVTGVLLFRKFKKKG